MNRTARLIAAAALSLAALWMIQRLPSGVNPRCADAMLRSAEIMERAIRAIQELRGPAAGINRSIDPNATGLIGPKYGPLMTTVGELEAKRSTTNPNIAGYITGLLSSAGVGPGDQVAIGSSGSFPALLVASLAAVKALDAHPVTILSLGASCYGATDPDFNLFDIYQVLQQHGICNEPPAAISLGGDRDLGLDFDTAVRNRLTGRIRDSHIPFLEGTDLPADVTERMRIYSRNAAGRIKAFINSGGGYANLGTSNLALTIRPGLNISLPLPPEPQRGVVFEMASRGIPVIHLLFIKGLVMQAGLPWDPIPLPKPEVLRLASTGREAFWLVISAYFVFLILLAVPYKTRRQ